MLQFPKTHTSQAIKSSIHLFNTLNKVQGPNCLTDRIPIKSNLNVHAWKFYLDKFEYWDHQIIQFLTFGFPLEVAPGLKPVLKAANHPTAHAFPSHVTEYLDHEIKMDENHET